MLFYLFIFSQSSSCPPGTNYYYDQEMNRTLKAGEWFYFYTNINRDENATSLTLSVKSNGRAKVYASDVSNCPNLTTIPSSMKLPNCIQTCQSMFNYDFSQLSSDISYIWPDEFEYTGTIDLQFMFGAVLASHIPVTGTVPADKLWNSGKTFNSLFCFAACTSLTNYDEIPADWK